MAEQISQAAKKYKGALPYPTLITRLCYESEFPYIQGNDKCTRSKPIITMINYREKYLQRGHKRRATPLAPRGMPPSPQINSLGVTTSTPSTQGIAMFEVMDNDHSDQLSKLAITITSLICRAFKNAMKPLANSLSVLARKWTF